MRLFGRRLGSSSTAVLGTSKMPISRRPRRPLRPGLGASVEGINRNWFEAQTELNQNLEGVMAALWDDAVVKPLERRSNESASEPPEEMRSPKSIPFARPVSA
jgi:hypothetical protein